MKEKVRISASRIKTVRDCSWKFYAQYELKIPAIMGEGALRGSCVHIILECLIKERHHRHYKYIKDNSGKLTKEIERLTIKLMKKFGIYSQENLLCISDMLYTAIQFDFLCSGANKLEIEKEFVIENDKYIIKGFIDKLAVYDNGTIVVWDYKSSKSKFPKEELDYNMQAFVYSLAVLKILKRIPKVKFLFLRFEKQPIQEAPLLTEKQIKGFEILLDEAADYLMNFDRKKALSDMAFFNEKKQWLCGKIGLNKDGSTSYICEYREPFFYYILCDELDNIIERDRELEKIEKKKKNQETIKKILYKGCPAWHKKLLPRFPFLIKK